MTIVIALILIVLLDFNHALSRAWMRFCRELGDADDPWAYIWGLIKSLLKKIFIFLMIMLGTLIIMYLAIMHYISLNP